jgi:hypothetical protein
MARYAAERENELSCRDATGTNTMAETVAIDRVSVGTGAAPRLQPDLHRQTRNRRRDPAARDGFSLDQSRVAYLRYLRREHRRSQRAEADADHVKVKTEMLQLRLMEKKRELVRRADVDELIDGIAGVTLAALSLRGVRRVVILRSGVASSGSCLTCAPR